MKTFAWVILAFFVVSVLLQPLIWGRDREQVGVGSFYHSLGSCIAVAVLCGRILGWW